MAQRDDARRRTCWRSGARPGRTSGSRRTRPSTPRSRARFLATYEAAAAGRLVRLGGDAGGRARAADRARPVSAQHVPRPGAHLRGRSAGARQSPTRASRAASTSEVAARRAPVLLPAVHAFRGRWPTRSAASRWSRALSATTSSPNMPSSTPTSSAASAASRTATRCSAAPPRPTSRHSSTPADLPADAALAISPLRRIAIASPQAR